MIKASFIAIALFLSVAVQPSFAQVTGTTVYTPANYLTYQPPVKGGSYIDAVFGTAIKRVTDSMKTTRDDTGGTLATITPEYSTMSPFNIDNTRLLLVHFSYFGLYDGSGNFLKDLPFEINASSQPRWSKADPNVLYYLTVNQLKQYNAGTGAMSIVHTFSEYAKIDGAGESDISFDGTSFVLNGDRNSIFVYNVATGNKGSVLNTGGRSYDSLYITNNYVTVTWNSTGTARYQGIELFDRNMTFQRQLTRAGGHMDVSQDSDGSDILIWTNSADPAPICNNGIVKVRFSDGLQTCLAQLDWSLAVHISAPDNSGWVFVETYNPNDIIPPTGWKTYTDEFLQIKLDGSQVRRLAHHRSRPLDSYTYMPKISVSHDGTKLVFGSNFGLQAQLSYPTEYSDTYLIDLGSGAAPVPPPPVIPPPTPPPTGTTTRFEQTASNVALTGNWSTNTNVVHSGGSAVLAMDAGSRATFGFSGTGANWIGYSDEWSGIANVYVDGAAKGQIDTYSTPFKAQKVEYSIAGLTNGNHILTIEVTGTKSAASGGSWIWVDAFESVTSVTGTFRVEDSFTALKFTGTWSSIPGNGFSGGTAKRASDASSQVSFTFTGTDVSWLAYRDASSGIARVYIDGVLKGPVDTYSPTPLSKSKVYSISGLPLGTHTIMIQVTGTHRTASLGSWVWVDALDYTGAPQ